MVYYIWALYEQNKLRAANATKNIELPEIIIMEEQIVENEFTGVSGRVFRNTFPTSTISDPEMKCNIARVPAGRYGKNILVHANGDILISNKAYPDDVLALILKGMLDNPTISDEIKLLIAEALDKMDERAVKRHGYSHSEVEKNHVYVSLADTIKNAKKVAF